MKFRVNSTGILENWFVANASGSIFVADIINGAPNGNGLRGLVRATAPLTTVPEPASLTLLGIGLIGLAKRARRKVR